MTRKNQWGRYYLLLLKRLASPNMLPNCVSANAQLQVRNKRWGSPDIIRGGPQYTTLVSRVHFRWPLSSILLPILLCIAHKSRHDVCTALEMVFDHSDGPFSLLKALVNALFLSIQRFAVFNCLGRSYFIVSMSEFTTFM